MKKTILNFFLMLKCNEKNLTVLVLLLTLFTYGQTKVYNVTLNGANESPANSSLGTGTATITVDLTAQTLRLQCDFSGLSDNVTVCHIHAATTTADTGTAGVATQTPTFSGFPAGVTSGTYDTTFDMTLSASYNASYITANGGTTATAFVALADAIDQSKAYLNIHSSAFAGGEIRGFTQAALGVNDFDLASKFKIYPNPVVSQFTMELQEIGRGTLTIMDLNGRVLKQQVIRSNIDQVDMSVVSKGVYLAKINTDKGLVTKRIVKD